MNKTIYFNGNVITVNEKEEVATAVMVEDGKIVKVGSCEEILSLKDDKTEVIEKRVPGDYEFVVGNEEKAGNKRLLITKIKIRDGVFRSRKGDVVLAKYVKRIFARKKGEGSGQRDFRRGPW